MPISTIVWRSTRFQLLRSRFTNTDKAGLQYIASQGRVRPCTADSCSRPPAKTSKTGERLLVDPVGNCAHEERAIQAHEIERRLGFSEGVEESDGAAAASSERSEEWFRATGHEEDTVAQDGKHKATEEGG